MMISYEDFDLRVRADGDEFVVTAQLGTQTSTEPLPIGNALLKDLRFLEHADSDVIRHHGEALFEVLIRGRNRDLYQQGRGRAGNNSGAGLRIRLFFDPRDKRVRPLIAVPWEILRDPADTNPLPALDPRRPIVRVIETVEQQLLPAEGPLERVLLVLGRPEEESEPDLDLECGSVKAALAGIPIRADVVRKATPLALFEAISDASPQIVHFIGHSQLDPQTGQGVLLLQNPSGEEAWLSGLDFARWFIGKPAPRLVILTSCLSAMGGLSEEPFGGIASALVAVGLPAVIAMQTAIREDDAIRFTDRLYRRLADGDPIEAAVANARRAVSVGRLAELHWAAPVLFMRASSAPVVPPTHQPASPVDPPAVVSTTPQPVVNMHISGPVYGTTAGHVENLYVGTKPDRV